MVKKLLTRKKVAAKSKKRPAAIVGGIDEYAVKHMRMLDDPCSAELSESVYPGDRGYINRFVLNGVAGVGAGIDSWAIIIKPGNAVAAYAATVGAGTTFPISYGNSYPGTAFYNANASKTRAVASCISIRPSAAPNNATGTIHYGVVNASSVSAGFTVSCTTLAGFTTESVSASQALINPLEIKWSPGGFDDRYQPNVASDDDSDRNVILVVGLGFAPGTGVQTRMTAITEWAPLQQLGVVADATAVKRSSCDKDCIVAKLKSRDPNWWWSLGKKAYRIGKDVAIGYGAGGAVGAMGAAVKYM